MRRPLLAILLTLALPVGPATAAAQAPAIAAAADLKFALAEIASQFRAATGGEVRIAYGSSGNFAHQIENGAPFELFLSADEAYVERLAAKGLTRDAGTLYAIGRIVLFVPRGSTVEPDPQLAGLRAALRDGRIKRFAIANPEHAPYGRAAREALQQADLWQAIRPVLVLGENASQATQFAASGSAEGGIVPLSLARAPEIARLGTSALIPADAHRPLRQRMVLLRDAGPAAAAFFAWLQTPSARKVFVHYGFVLPGEQ